MCAECLPPLKEENRDAVEIYLVTRNQVVWTGGMGSSPTDVNHLAVHEAMRLYGVKDRRRCFEKVLRLARYMIDKQLEAAKEKAENAH